MTPPRLPAYIQSRIKSAKWGTHHWQWHITRWWSRAWARDEAENNGWSKADRQEGEAGNGLDFLFMHRAMILELKESFPNDSQYFSGWLMPPNNHKDADNPVPNPEEQILLPEKWQRAIKRVHEHLDTFEDEDHLGLYLQTNFDPEDDSDGIHNYLHGRFTDRQVMESNMSDPRVNLHNQFFWRLHGWIDSRWTAFRDVSGASDQDQQYLKRLESERAHMSLGHHAGHWIEPDMPGTTVEKGEAESFKPLSEEVQKGLAEIFS